MCELIESIFPSRNSRKSADNFHVNCGEIQNSDISSLSAPASLKMRSYKSTYQMCEWLLLFTGYHEDYLNKTDVGSDFSNRNFKTKSFSVSPVFKFLITLWILSPESRFFSSGFLRKLIAHTISGRHQCVFTLAFGFSTQRYIFKAHKGLLRQQGTKFYPCYKRAFVKPTCSCGH